MGCFIDGDFQSSKKQVSNVLFDTCFLLWKEYPNHSWLSCRVYAAKIPRTLCLRFSPHRDTLGMTRWGTVVMVRQLREWLLGVFRQGETSPLVRLKILFLQSLRHFLAKMPPPFTQGEAFCYCKSIAPKCGEKPKQFAAIYAYVHLYVHLIIAFQRLPCVKGAVTEGD